MSRTWKYNVKNDFNTTDLFCYWHNTTNNFSDLLQNAYIWIFFITLPCSLFRNKLSLMIFFTFSIQNIHDITCAVIRGHMIWESFESIFQILHGKMLFIIKEYKVKDWVQNTNSTTNSYPHSVPQPQWSCWHIHLNLSEYKEMLYLSRFHCTFFFWIFPSIHFSFIS